MASTKSKFFIIHVIVLFIAIACVLMNGPMRNGLPIDNSVIERISFISNHTLLWQSSWVLWMCCALGLLTFCVIIADEIKPDFKRTCGLLIVALGVAPDLAAEVLYAFIITKAIAAGATEDVFSILEITASHLTGFLGNGLYNLGGLLLTCLALKEKVLKPWVAMWGIVAWVLGLLLSAAIAADSMKAAEFFTASSMVLSTTWMLVFAYTVLRPKWITH